MSNVEIALKCYNKKTAACSEIFKNSKKIQNG